MSLEKSLIGEIRTFGLEMYTGMPNPIRLPENISPPSLCDNAGRSASHPHYKPTPINPVLGGGTEIYLEKCRPNTTILKEELGYGFKNIYLHHDRGPGRIEFVDPIKKEEKSLFDVDILLKSLKEINPSLFKNK